ncbi:hypothetical protein ACMFMF_010198 [Clarireedia jacksonii]
MELTSQSTTESTNDPVANGKFQFITILSPADAKDDTTKRRARSHAVKQALENKRKLQQESGENFRVASSKDYSRRLASEKIRSQPLVTLPLSIPASTLDPFQTLAVDSSRFYALLGNYKARQASEPVFSVTDKLAFHSFHKVFEAGLDDPALLNAVMLTFAFAATEGGINRECLGYQSKAISHIRKRMNSLDRATLITTIGAILLLAGVEARLGMQFQVQIHMRAIQRILDICQKEGIYLTDGIKRAIFWQDLNSSVMTGSSRVVNYTTFTELQWKRDSYPPSFFRLPPGFQVRSHILTKELVETLEDIHALQSIRELSSSSSYNPVSMAHINNHQASIQSRLVGLVYHSPVLECCKLAAYLCSSMLCCKVWCALVIPNHVSLRLLRELQQVNDDPIWDDHSELLLWLLYIGGAFTTTETVRSDYIILLRLNNSSILRGLYKSWQELYEILKRFIWSDSAFTSDVKALWEEVTI